MADLVLQLELDKVIQLVSQLSREDKEKVLRYLENELGIFPRPVMEITPPMTDVERLKLAEELGKAGPISHYVIEEREQGY